MLTGGSRFLSGSKEPLMSITTEKVSVAKLKFWSIFGNFLVTHGWYTLVTHGWYTGDTEFFW